VRSARVLVPIFALLLGLAAAFGLARSAAAGDRPCNQGDRDCKHDTTAATTTAKTATTTTGKTTTTTKTATSTTKSQTTTTTSTAPKTTTTKTTVTKGAAKSVAKPSSAAAKAKAATSTAKTSAKAKAAAKNAAKSPAKGKAAAAAAAKKPKPKQKKAKSAGPPAAGVVALVDKPFVCSGPVHLASVMVTIRNVSSDAVLLRSGCTGSIGRISVVQYHGDGIKVGNAHDLVIGGGSIRCYSHDVGKHQDGIQILGGRNVTFSNMDVGCYSANNSQVWINDGSGSGPGGIPTNIVFQGGRFQGYFNRGQYGPGGAYGVAIVGSMQSGVRNATICPNAHPAHALYVAASAQAPVTSGTVISRTC
jgi:hypothetical protein